VFCPAGEVRTAGGFAAVAGAVAPFAQVVFPILKVDGTAVRTRLGSVVPPDDADCNGGKLAALALPPLGLLAFEGETEATVAVAVADAFAPSDVVTTSCKECGPAVAWDAGNIIAWLPLGSIASKGWVCCAVPSTISCAWPA